MDKIFNLLNAVSLSFLLSMSKCLNYYLSIKWKVDESTRIVK